MTRTLVIVALAAALGVPTASRADRRYYGETYNASTAPRGSLDVELWTTYADPPRDAAGVPGLWRHQLELETGITDRWDVAVYGVARQVRGEAVELEAVKLESRLALAAPGTWFVDPVLYVELQKTLVEDRPFSIEEKLILAKDVGRLNAALNVAAEQELAGGEVHPEWSYALGSSWEIVPAFRLGAELFGDVADVAVSPGVERRESQAWAGPAASIAVARSWLVLAAGLGLNGESDAFRARAILAFQF
ncbi:MAG TPA: hypothetical protein VF841_06995 [Anaeromyxobacter sp.]